MTDGGGRLWFAPSLPDFTPGIAFADVDLSGAHLPKQFAQRIRGYYLEPATITATAGYTFAAGLLLVSCIDALAKIQTNDRVVRSRFRNWTTSELMSFKNEEVNRRFYEDFRNGLVHEARVMRGGRFSLEQDVTAVYQEPILSINPLHLAKEVQTALSRFVARVEDDQGLRVRLVETIRSEFEYEFECGLDERYTVKVERVSR